MLLRIVGRANQRFCFCLAPGKLNLALRYLVKVVTFGEYFEYSKIKAKQRFV